MTTPIKLESEVVQLAVDGDGNVQRPARRPFGRKPKEPTEKKLDFSKAKKKFTRKGAFESGETFAAVDMKGVRDKKLKGAVRKSEAIAREAVQRLAMSEVILTKEEGFIETGERERTFKATQKDICGGSIAVAAKQFDMQLPMGPYSLDFSRNGRYMVVGGAKGHVAMLDCQTMSLEAELNLDETVRDVQFLHSKTMFAVAQRKYGYIYDGVGTEVHCLSNVKYPTCMEYLPYHYLLVTGTDPGMLMYRDVSTGEIAMHCKTNLGSCTALRHNPMTGVVHMGSTRGVVSLWTPNLRQAAVKLLCHKGPITALACDGNYLTTAGADGRWRVWDVRKYERSVNSYRVFGGAVSSMDISMTGQVALGYAGRVEIWKDCFKERAIRPYLDQRYQGATVSSVRFRPFEDVLGVGHSKGFGTLVIPGAGLANYDAYENNPFETAKQRKESEVRKLMDKLQPDTIVLDPTLIGSVNEKLAAATEATKAAVEVANAKRKNKARGKGKIGKKQSALVKERVKKVRKEVQDRAEEAAETTKRTDMRAFAADKVPTQSGALGRFNR